MGRLSRVDAIQSRAIAADAVRGNKDKQERIVRAAHVPVLVASRAFSGVEHVAIAYDGGASSEKALTYIVGSPLLRGLVCHVITAGRASEETTATVNAAVGKLNRGGFAVKTHLQPGRPNEVLAAYCEANAISLLVMGAYGHSRIRNFVIGSTTSAMIRSCHIPVLLFR